MFQFVIAHNHIPWFDLSFAREPTSISIATQMNRIQRSTWIARSFTRSYVLILLPNIEHAVFMSKS
jgi:hypothetical protein